ncbi:MAG: Flp family type IVb pilin [Oscillospiraceae bacterium]|nr:Flp family type IVb pilin [Oscillospiraceae bacterium]
MLKKFLADENGQGMVEYGLILALVAVVVIAALTAIGGNLKGKMEEIGTKLG